ncbi:MAG: prepilin-type N-terminal cleavage/methylation domain-containing protein [Candidatus Eremiobacteraeota bacterium]|nr:prepilin-type N-terminal cleavage/methylation domain-containing protein [Candidatus Eremiobacteraeota bacterium]
MIRARRHSSGFTLSEIMVAVVLFALFATTLLAILTMALRSMTRSDRLVNAQRNVMAINEVISTELRTAVVNESSTGYRSLSPVPPSTAVLAPSSVGGTSAQLTFNVPRRGVYDPCAASFNPADPANYQVVRYYVSVSGREMHREVKLYTTSGALISTVDATVAETEDGLFTFSATLTGSDLVTLTLTCTEGTGPGSEVFSIRNVVCIPSS